MPVDPRWPKVLSLSVHEFRTPMTVVAGYIRMLLKDRAGALTEPQRKLLEEAEKSCARLSALLVEMSDVSNLEAGTLTINRQQADLRAAVRAAAEQLPPLTDREIAIDLQLGEGPAPVTGDPIRLVQAIGAVMAALRRELVTSPTLTVRERSGSYEGAPAHALQIGDADALAAIEAARLDELPAFDEWRGGVGLSLMVARRIIEAHGGRLTGAPEGRKTGAGIVIPSS